MLFKIRSFLRNLYVSSWSIPIALLVLTLLSYGLRALSLGFFWDDLPYLWIFHRAGPAGIVAAFSGDRPFLSFIYNLSLSLFGDSAQAWQIFGLIARWICVLGFWCMLAQAWPKHVNKAAWAAALFAVYPGFTQQWIVVIYGQDFILFAAVFFSIAISLWITRHRHSLGWAWITAGTILALALSAFCMFSTEYFFGLEMLRPILMWIVLTETSVLPPHIKVWLPRLRRDLLRTAAGWAPYLALMISFVIWRGFIHVFPGRGLGALEMIQQNPLAAVLSLSQTIFEDLVEASLVAWGQPLQKLNMFLEADPATGLRLLFVIVTTGLLTGLYLARLCPEPEIKPNGAGRGWRWGSQAVLIGAFAMLAGGLPFWITRLPMRMGFPQDRYSLSLSAGLCLAMAGLVDLLGGPERAKQGNPLRKIILISSLVALAAGFHYSTSQSYRTAWNDVRGLYWQLTWRAPAVQPGTLFLTEKMKLPFYEDDSLSAPLNWTYDPDGQGEEIHYFLFDADVRRATLNDLRAGVPVIKGFRNYTFNGSVEKSLALYYAPPGCLRILDPRYDSDLTFLPQDLQREMDISNPAALIQDSGTPAVPPAFLGGEPKHRWCYYFEKADLARQQGQWQTIVDLARQSIGQGYRPEDASEYLPFIEGFARTGYWDDAYQMTEAAFNKSVDVRIPLCAVWRRSTDSSWLNQANHSEPNQRAISQANLLLSCPVP